MIPLRIKIELMIIISCLLLVAGCTLLSGGEKNSGNTTISITPNPTTSTLIPTTVMPTQCPNRVNGTYALVAGYPFTYTGVVPNPDISTVRIWIFGKNYAEITSIPVKADGSYNFTLNADHTQALNGTYRLIAQFPQTSNQFNINPIISESKNVMEDKSGRLILNIQNIRDGNADGLDTADKLEREIGKPGNGDRSINATLNVESPWVHINPIGNYTVGDKFTLSGTTNLAAGYEDGFIDFWSVSYVPTLSNGGTMEQVSPVSFPLFVTRGSCGNNSWSWDVDTSNFKPDEYFVAITFSKPYAQTSEIFKISGNERFATTDSTKLKK
jgi:hypothetical protein